MGSKENYFDMLQYERDLIKKGYSVICGVDEVGTGNFAGPVVACAIVLDLDKAKKIRFGKYKINDSKQVPKKIREKMFKKILQSTYAVGISIVDVSEINHIDNISKCGYIARQRAVSNLARSGNLHCHIYWHPSHQNLSYANKIGIRYTPIVPNYILVDGPFLMKEIKDVPVQPLIGGDTKSISIAAASIIAKVIHSRIMNILHQINHMYVYGWNVNYGAGTKWHRDAIKKFGITHYHHKGVKELV